MKNPPVLVAVLGFFAALAGLSYLFFGLRVLGFDWFGVLGDLPTFERVGLWGWLAIVTGIVWLLAAFGLWALQPWARLFAMIIAGIGLFEAFLAFFQFPGTGLAFGMAILPGLVLWYMSTSEVKQAFGLEAAPSASQPQATPAPVAATSGPAAPAAVGPVAGAAAVVTETSSPEPVSVAPAPVVEAAPSAARQMKVEDVEGIGPANGARLAASGILTIDDLLAAGATRPGRDKLAEETGISHNLILAWVNKADLMRVPGVSTQYSDLLELAGVDSPAELSHRNAANLARTFQDAVAARPGTVRRIPSEAEIAVWIEEAAKLPTVVEH